MPVSDLAQRIAEMKAAAEKARDAYPNVAWFTVADLQRSRVVLSVVCSEYIAQASPAAVLALIAELERQEREVERLREDLRILTKGKFIQS